MKLWSTMGVEFTYLPPEIFDFEGMVRDSDFEGRNNEEGVVSTYAYQIKKELTTNRKKKFNFLDVHNDCGAIEIGSPIFNNFDTMKNFYQKLEKVAKKKYNLVTHSDRRGSGGGHIHVGIPKNISDKELLLFLINIRRDMGNRPYLNYIFNEYCDDHTSNHYLIDNSYGYRNYNRYGYKFLSPSIKKFEKIAELFKTAQTSSQYYGGCCVTIPFQSKKDSVVRGKIISSMYGGDETYTRVNDDLETIEFRIFDVPQSVEDLESHVMFVNNYMKYIYDITKKGELIQNISKNKKQAKEYCQSFTNKIKTKREFKNLLKKIELNYSDYERFYKRNYLVKVKEGYKLR